jgi:hypothetical protein
MDRQRRSFVAEWTHPAVVEQAAANKRRPRSSSSQQTRKQIRAGPAGNLGQPTNSPHYHRNVGLHRPN